MSETIISGTIALTVTLGSASYASPLTISNTGTVLPSGAANPGQAGIASNPAYFAGKRAIIQNDGVIQGAIGGSTYVPAAGYLGGDGINLVSTQALITNTGRITGGAGGTMDGAQDPRNLGVDGGAGVVLAVETLINTGTILGGSGGTSTGSGPANGGAGVLLEGGTVVNAGTIAGGAGGENFAGQAPTSDAIDIMDGDDTLVVDPGAMFIGDVVVSGPVVAELVLAGSAPATLGGIGTEFTGFSGLSFAAGANWTAEGSVAGLTAGQSINGFTYGDTIVLDGFAATSDSFAAGIGLILSNATASETLGFTALPASAGFVIHSSAAVTTITPVETIVNAATRIGAAGQNGVTFYQYPGTPGEFGGAAPSIPVGTNGGRGGAGFYLTVGTFGINTGIILGGVGGYGGPGIGKPAGSGDGGTGVSASGGTFFNQGTLQGGAGGHGTNGGHSPSEFFYGGGDGGNGGAGVYLAQGATATNSGVILGGAAGAGGAAYIYSVETFAAGSAGLGGVGVNVADGTLVNDGTIAGNGGVEVNNGVLIDAGSIASTTGNPAVAFGYGSGTLVLYPNAVFTGDVLADATGSDALVLAGTGGTALLGTALRNFGTISLQPGATWTLEGDTAALAAGQTITGFAAGDEISLGLSASTTDSFVSGDTIVLDGFAATSDSFAAGIGLVLSNATASATLAVTSASGVGFIVTSYGGASTIVSVSNPLVNTGYVFVPYTTAVTLQAGYTLVNDGTIHSGFVYTSYVTPQGETFFNGRFGVGLYGNDGHLTNTLPSLDNSGIIYGVFGGVVLQAGGNITNSGLIEGATQRINLSARGPGHYSYFSSDAIQNEAGAFTLTVEPGAAFGHAVMDDAGTGVLILAGTTASSLNAQDFTGFQNIDFASGASWSLALDAPSFGSSQTISGLSSSDTIAISHIRGAGTIELAGFSATASSYASGIGLVLSNATASETLVVSGSYSTASFTVTENADGGTDVSVACFCAGTRIATPRGNIAVEKLRIGELVNTMHGPRPIKWIGRRAYAARFLAMGGRPIRIRRHAIAFNVPSRDLYVSPDHAIAEGGVLIHAHLLINGVSITQAEITGDVEYFHLELDAHSIIFAENLATESFIDEGARQRFANAHTAPEAAPQKPCLPRVAEGFHLHNIKTRIARRAGVPEPGTIGALRGCIDDATPNLVRGWAQDVANPEAPVLLEIFSGGAATSKTPEIFSTLVLANAYRADLREAGLGSGCHGFAVPLPGPLLTLRRVQDGAALPKPAEVLAWRTHRSA